MDLMDNFNKMAGLVQGQINTEIDIEKVMSSEMGDVIDYGMWLETVEIQKKFNNSVAPGWQIDVSQQKYDYWMAVLDETLEVLNSKHWKWWKDSAKMGQVDWANVRVELVDLFLFLMSIAIQQNSQQIIFQQLLNLEMNKDQPGQRKRIKDDRFFDDFWQQFLGAVHMKSLPVSCIKLVEFWFRAGGDVGELFMEYRIKTALNDIRQEFGYGTSTYSKMWLDVEIGEKVEDNVMATKLAKDVPLDENTVKAIKDNMRRYYLTHVAI